MGTIRRWNEYEDWIEICDRRQLAAVGNDRYTLVLNFGGPGAETPYHLYARVTAGNEQAISEVEVERTRLESAFEALEVPGMAEGMRWVHLGIIRTKRDYRRLTITVPGGLSRIDTLCLVQIPDRMLSGEVERQVRRRGLAPEPLSGVPLGGIGAGKVEFCRDGRFRNITINGNIDTPIRQSEGSFLAIRAESEGRALGRVVGSESLHGLPPFEETEYEGLYPRATWRGRDRYLPISVEIVARGTIAPRKVSDSSLPLALFSVRVSSTTHAPVKASVAFSWENLLGLGGTVADRGKPRESWDEGFYSLWEERHGNYEMPWQGAEGSGLLFDGGEKEEKRSEGQYILAMDGESCNHQCSWRPGMGNQLWADFVDRGELPVEYGDASTGEATAGAIAVSVDLAPGEVREIRFVLAWYVPHFWQAEGHGDYSHYYCNEFDSAAAVAEYGLRHFARLSVAADEVPELLQRSTLPEWLKRSLPNDAYVMSTDSWLTKDGRFAINEGASHMFGCMGTLDQKLYANHYATLFFPELDRTELLGFARAQGDNGAIQHDLGFGHLEQKKRGHGWPDLTSSMVILSLKHYQLTGDQAYIDEVYPVCVKALLEFQLGMDSDDDGIANISGVGNTFDAEKFEGTSSYIATVWLAALKSLEELAERRRDRATAERCREIFAKARTSAIAQLWNGRYFANYYDSSTQKGSPNSHISQVAGEFFARLMQLGPLYGDEYVRQALDSMLKLNYHPRLVFPTNEATPEGRMPCRTMWGWLPHTRVYLGGIPLFFDMAERGLDALRRMDEVIERVNHGNRWDLRLFYEPDTGREHWGRFYMTAAATWYIYQALVGYFLDKPKGTLGFLPNLPDSLLPFEGPIFLPDVWLWLRLDSARSTYDLRVIKSLGDGPLRIHKLLLPVSSTPPRVILNGEVVSLALEKEDAQRGSCGYRTYMELG